MRISTRTPVVASAFAALAAVAFWAARREAAADLPAWTELEVRNLDIALYEGRAARDTLGAADRARLAALYLQRARETGDYEDFRRSERAARAALALRTAHNTQTTLVLASSLLAQHRFPESLAETRALVDARPDVPAYRALLGELQLEMGDYDAARVTFDSLARHARDLAVAPRLARWAEITGRPAHARWILSRAVADVRTRTDLPREQVAWFHLRLGDLELRNGRLDHAELAFEAGLEANPDDHRIIAATARLAAERRRWREAIWLARRLGDRADIATLALAGDASAALGDTTAAERWFARAERQGRENPEPFNRQWTLYRLDHRRHLDETLAILRDEIRVRRDVYGYDQLAWALYRVGSYAAAREAMERALRMGTQDAMLFRHAGLIEQALGAPERARHFLDSAERVGSGGL
jgi:tetratricopeptide (TPR) repeat protein